MRFGRVLREFDVVLIHLVQQEPDLGFEGQPIVEQSLVFSRPNQKLVKREIQLTRLARPPGAGGPLDVRLHLLEIVVRRVSGRQIHCQFLQGQPQAADIIDVGLGELGHADPTIIPVQQSLLEKCSQSFPNRPPANTKLGGNLRLGNSLPRLQHPRQDGITKQVGHTLRQCLFHCGAIPRRPMIACDPSTGDRRSTVDRRSYDSFR